MTARGPINIAILAMGGEGGGVLTDWLVHVGETAGYLAQKTSVPGVAQRTGATIYYVELFPKDAAGRTPVLGLMPMPGDVDLLIASELMEAGRAVQRGLATPDRTHFIASTHRVYSMTERTAIADGRVDADAIVAACRSVAMTFVGFDMQRLAEENRSVISAVLLGAIAASAALPFARGDYEAAIRAGGKGAKPSLAAFAAGFAAASDDPPARQPDVSNAPEATRPIHDVAVSDTITGEARRIILAGIERTADYQDVGYAQNYYDRLKPFIDLANGTIGAGQALLCETARQLALGMTYEDTVRVAELKIRSSRFARVHEEVGAAPGQIVEIVEFMHPRIEEIADSMPAWLGRWLLANGPAKTIVAKLTLRGRTVRTSSLPGFLMLYALASMKSFRRGTLRYGRENRFLEEWLDSVKRASSEDIAFAVGLAELRNLVKGYGDTHERGLAKYRMIHQFVSRESATSKTGETVRRLIAVANASEGFEGLEAEMSRFDRSGGPEFSVSR